MNQFYQELLKLPKNIRQTGEKCIVGIENKDLIYTSLIDKTEISTADNFTNKIKEFSVFLGSDAKTIIQAFVGSDFLTAPGTGSSFGGSGGFSPPSSFTLRGSTFFKNQNDALKSILTNLYNFKHINSCFL